MGGIEFTRAAALAILDRWPQLVLWRTHLWV
jgi:hypothetical protein